MKASRSARVPPAFAGAGSRLRAGHAHRDDLVLVDAGAQQRRDPFDVRLEGVGEVPVLFRRRRRCVGDQQKLGLCIDQRGGRGPEVVVVLEYPRPATRLRGSMNKPPPDKLGTSA
jgi:hypothetical protein